MQHGELLILTIVSASFLIVTILATFIFIFKVFKVFNFFNFLRDLDSLDMESYQSIETLAFKLR